MTGDFQIGNPAGYPLIGTGCEYYRDIRLLFYCQGVMINDTGLFTCGAVTDRRRMVVRYPKRRSLRVKRETGQTPVRARHCRSGVHEYCPCYADSHWRNLPGRRFMHDDG